MTILNERQSLLLIIDVQPRLLNAVFNQNIVLKKSVIMSKAASLLNIPAVVTEQYPNGLGATIEHIKSSLNKSTQYVEKSSFSALTNPAVLNFIAASGKKQIVVFGIETHICVSQTVLDLIDRGFSVTVISDACGSRFESEYNAGLQHMKDCGANVITTEIALFEWLRSSRHPRFKEIQALIK